MSDELIAVALGGLIATVAGVLTPIVQTWLAGRREDQKSRIEDLRALVMATYELDDWCTSYRRRAGMGQDVEIGRTPLAEIEALVYSAFPEAKYQFLQLNVVVADFKEYCTARSLMTKAEQRDSYERHAIIDRQLAMARSNLVSKVCGGHLFDLKIEAYPPEAAKLR